MTNGLVGAERLPSRRRRRRAGRPRLRGRGRAGARTASILRSAASRTSDALRLVEAGQVEEVRVLPVLVLDVVVADEDGRGREHGDGRRARRSPSRRRTRPERRVEGLVRRPVVHGHEAVYASAKRRRRVLARRLLAAMDRAHYGRFVRRRFARPNSPASASSSRAFARRRQAQQTSARHAAPYQLAGEGAARGPARRTSACVATTRVRGLARRRCACAQLGGAPACRRPAVLPGRRGATGLAAHVDGLHVDVDVCIVETRELRASQRRVDPACAKSGA